MAFSETCARCGEEVRYGVRDNVTGYHHRLPVDHAPVFGNIAFNETIDYDAIRASKADKNGEEDDRIWDIPAPEVTATEIEPGDERMAGGARILIKACLKEGKRAGIDVAYRATYARGARVHASQGNYLGMSDSVVVRVRVDDRTGTAAYVDGKLDFAWITHYAQSPKDGHRIVTVEQVPAAALRAHLLPNEPKRGKKQEA